MGINSFTELLFKVVIISLIFIITNLTYTKKDSLHLHIKIYPDHLKEVNEGKCPFKHILVCSNFCFQCQKQIRVYVTCSIKMKHFWVVCETKIAKNSCVVFFCLFLFCFLFCFLFIFCLFVVFFCLVFVCLFVFFLF